ncbi:hypothetical protein EV182_001770 [Spiromyces aspiralis]|uniref:Uncharacterized protein n=1 Tax=Spiromyces aspiralis TaxID=68401 RepID=A0ACC1HG71_9FUNG|nr:hypothetical protein EV182_001770 [Spiromyces aspiralis]
MDNFSRNLQTKFKKLGLNQPGRSFFGLDPNNHASDDLLDLDMEAFREATIEGDDSGELANYVNTKLIYEAGVDYESKPMLVFAACHLPDPDRADYDRLLNLIIFRLDDFVENDYTVVFFAAPNMYTPTVKWLVSAYRRLGRKYKKNLKSLYIVHPSRWIRFLFTAMGPIFSPKFSKKVEWVDTLSGLARFVPIDQLQIPQPVYQYNSTKEAEIVVPHHHLPWSPRYFGVPIEDLMGHDGARGLPPPVADAIDFIYSSGLTTHGIFRKSPVKTTLDKVYRMYEVEDRTTVTYALWGEHVAASILKMWCRKLPYPIVPSIYYSLVRGIPFDKEPGADNQKAAEYIRDVLLPALSDPPCIAMLLAAIMGLLKAVAERSEENGMSPVKLAICWAPNFVRSNQPDLDVMMCSATRFSIAPTANADTDQSGGASDVNVIHMIRLMIDHYELIFKETLERAEVQAKERAASITASAKRPVQPPPKPPRRNPARDPAAAPVDPSKSSSITLLGRSSSSSSTTTTTKEEEGCDTEAAMGDSGNNESPSPPSTNRDDGPTEGSVITHPSHLSSSPKPSPISAKAIVERLRSEREKAQQQRQKGGATSSESHEDGEESKVLLVEQVLSGEQ